MNAYLDALKMLARRELSETQVRQRLVRKGHTSDVIDAAVRRLVDERVIDDSRVAAAIARSETRRRHGKLRVIRRIEQAGIGRAIARRAVDDAFQPIDGDTLIEQSIDKRLRGRGRIADDKEFAKLFRYLVGQGFESDRILSALDRRKGRKRL